MAIADLLAVALLLVLSAGLGGRFLPGDDSALGLLEQLAVGLAAIAVLLLGLGAVGLLRPLPMTILLLGVALLAAPALRRLPGRVRAALPTLRAPLEFAAAVSLAAAALFVVVLALAPPVDWDVLMYHLDVPAEWLAAGRIHLPTDNLHAVHAGLLHLLYVPLLAFASPSAPAVLSAALAVLLGCTVAAGAARLFGREVAALSVSWLWGTGTILLVAATARVDVSLAFFLTLTQIELVRAAAGEDPERALPRASLMLGCAGGVKLLAVVFGVALLPLATWVLLRRLPAAKRMSVLAASAAAAVLPALPWLAKNWLLVGAPLYPVGASATLEPWLATLYVARPGLEWSLVGALTEVRESFSPWLVLVAPARLSVEWEAAFYHASPALFCLLLWLRDRRTAVINAFLGPALLYAAIVLVRSPPTNLRYFVPALPVLTIAAAALLCRVTVNRVALALALVIGLVPGALAARAWLTGTSAIPYALGRVPSELYLESHLDVGVRALSTATHMVEQSVPPDGRVLMLFDARGFAFSRNVIQDNRLNNWQLLAGLVEKGCLEETDVSHVLVNRGALAYYERRGLDPDRLRWREFESFETRCLESVRASAGFELYRLKRPATASPPA